MVAFCGMVKICKDATFFLEHFTFLMMSKAFSITFTSKHASALFYQEALNNVI